MTKLIALSSMLVGLGATGLVIAVQLDPSMLTKPGPKTVYPEPTAVRQAAPVVSHAVTIPEVSVIAELPRPIQKKIRPAPCNDGEWRVVGFEGPPSEPTAFRGVTLHCPRK